MKSKITAFSVARSALEAREEKRKAVAGASVTSPVPPMRQRIAAGSKDTRRRIP